MPRRVLFVIRGKLGDTLVAYATVRRFVEAFPGDEVTLLTRAGYAELLAHEPGIRLVGFESRIGMFAQLLRLRMRPRFDALLVLWGFGSPIEWIGRLVRARRKIYLDSRFPGVYPEHADLSPHRLQSEPMWRVARIFEPALPQPDRLRISSLAALRADNPSVIGVAPLADEPRRIFSAQMLGNLLAAISERHPGVPVRVFVNPSDRGARELLAAGLPPGVEFFFFPELQDLLRGFADLTSLYCTDTGLYHMAAAMGIPTTVFFGPTQPWRVVMPDQPAAKTLRLAVLGGEHCEEKSCHSPACLAGALRAFGGDARLADLDGTPAGCPLRAFPLERLAEVSVHENTRHQA
jgi:ADP-heptose:LPS heptosyltransferase